MERAKVKKCMVIGGNKKEGNVYVLTRARPDSSLN